MPLDIKVRDGQGKRILRQVLDQYIPRELIERPKMGFQLPIAEWLRGPLKEWGESLLNENRLREEGLLNPGPIRQKWHEHLSAGAEDAHSDLSTIGHEQPAERRLHAPPPSLRKDALTEGCCRACDAASRRASLRASRRRR